MSKDLLASIQLISLIIIIHLFIYFCLSAEAVFVLIKHNSHFMKRASKPLALAGRKGRADAHLVMDYLLYPAGVEI